MYIRYIGVSFSAGDEKHEHLQNLSYYTKILVLEINTSTSYRGSFRVYTYCCCIGWLHFHFYLVILSHHSPISLHSYDTQIQETQ